MTHNQSSIKNPVVKRKKRKENPKLPGSPLFCLWWQIPIHSGPLPGSNCPPLDSDPLQPFPTPSAFSPITLLTTKTSTITVFFVWDNNLLGPNQSFSH